MDPSQALEERYRTGYHQGYHDALLAIRIMIASGQSPDAAIKAGLAFVDRELAAWRRGDTSTNQMPPKHQT